MKLKNKKGFSLLEILLVLAIAAALVVGAFVIYPKVQVSSNVKKESDNIGVLRSGVSAMYGNTSNPPTNPNMNQVLINAQIVPDNMLTTTTGSIISGWGGPVYVGTGTVDGRPGFFIRYENLTNELCVKLLSSMANGFDEVKIASSNMAMVGIPSGGGTVVKSSTIEFTVINASSYCKSNTSGNAGSQILFGFL